MRHHTALQHGEHGPWHYVSAKPGQGAHPIGYCTTLCTHETADEAFEHYRQFLLDSAQSHDELEVDVQRKCEVCGTWTTGGMTWDLGWHSHHLCPEHRNRETLERIALPPGLHTESWQS